jgi:peptide-methionine (R)-S-oxide reductase
VQKEIMKSYPQEKQEVMEGAVHCLSRRTFVITTASVCGAAILWSLRRPAFVDAETKGAPAGNVTIINFSPDGKRIGAVTVPRVVKSDAAWRQQLSPMSYEVTRQADTEQPYTGSTWNLHEHGIFRCICCDVALFSSDTKFESGTGWPSFWQPIAKENVMRKADNTFGVARTEILCRLCEAHLGHVFDDGPRPTGLRYCMNSAAMRFVKIA